MMLLRTDKEVALNDLLMGCRETIDHYRDAVDLVSNQAVAKELRAIASLREPLCVQLEIAVRTQGSLPQVPDPDKEVSEMALHHMGAAVTQDYTYKILTQRLQAEERICELISKAHTVGLNGASGDLLSDIELHVKQTMRLLVVLLTSYGN
jgi:hypothetical protein